MTELRKTFKAAEGNRGSKRQDFFIEFGNFKIKKLADTKINRDKAEKRGSYYYLIDTLKGFSNNRVSSIFLLEGMNKFIFDTNTTKNTKDYPQGYYLGQETTPGELEIIEITKEQYKRYKASLGGGVCN